MRIAREAGAARVELTQALALGGLTPSQATIEITREVAGDDGPEVHALVRSRAGDFHYDADEIALMARDVRLALASRSPRARTVSSSDARATTARSTGRVSHDWWMLPLAPR